MFFKKTFISLRFSLIKVGGIYRIKLMEKNFSDTFLTAKGLLIILTFLKYDQVRKLNVNNDY